MQAQLPVSRQRSLQAIPPLDDHESRGEQLQFFGVHAHLTNAKAFAAFLAPLKKKRRFVYSKRPFAETKAVFAYLSRYTPRVAVSNRRLIASDGRQVTFKFKDNRIEDLADTRR